MSPSEHERSCDPAGPLIEQPEPVWLAMVHVMPVSDGNVSLRVTPVAVVGPLLPTVMWKPTLVPGLTGVASAVLVVAMLGWVSGGMVSDTQRSPASPGGLFWPPSRVMTWNREVWAGTNGRLC